MKTSKFFAILTSMSIVLFLSFASIANTYSNSTGDVIKASTNATSVSGENTTTADNSNYSYLRFDVNDYITNPEIEDISDNSLDYLRFDVKDYFSADEMEISELPIMNEYDYLRFDVNNFTANETEENFELPVNQYEYLRFDVTKYINTENHPIDELPVIK
jgi:hypothetical protein